MNTDTNSELRASPPPTARPSSSPRRGRSASASSRATPDYFNPNPDQWEGKVSALLQVFVVHQRIENQEHNTNCYTSAVGEAPSPDGRVLSDLASSCLAYAAVVALRSSACCLAHIIGQSDTRTSHVKSSEWSLDCSSVFRRCCVLLFNFC